MSSPHFSPALFDFLTQLKLNNDREWFNEHKPEYEEHVKKPVLRFISDFGPRLEKISDQFVADPRGNGGSMFRIYRDTRFSKDKTPYKTHVGCQFRHQATSKDVHAPGFYLHLEPGQVFAGVGLWRPPTPVAGKIRQAIDEKQDQWQAAISGTKFKKLFSLGGESLKRPPKGFAKDHPLIEDLKRKDFIASTTFDPKDAEAGDFLERFTKACQATAPLMKFLTEAVDLSW